MSPFKLKIDNCVTADVSRLSGIMKTFIRKSTPVFKKKREREKRSVTNMTKLNYTATDCGPQLGGRGEEMAMFPAFMC